MEELGYMWRNTYFESMDELKQKLLHTTIELEAVRMAAGKEAKMHKESTRHLLCLLKTTYQERDEARGQFQKLLNKLVVPSTVSIYMSPVFNQWAQVENPIMIPGKTNSGVTESGSLSLSHVSSPVRSFPDPVSSPELSNTNNAAVYSDGSLGLGLASRALDVGSCIIDNLAKGRFLPQKGQLLQAMTEAGPLLQTLLVAGPLPRWRNPPPLQPFRIPFMANADPKLQMCSPSFLTFGNCCHSSKPWFVSSVAGGSDRNTIAKRQRQD